jgi:CcmD family protein
MTRLDAKTVGPMIAVVVLVVGMLAVLPAAGFADSQAAAQAQPPAAGQGDFVPVKDLPQQETIPAAPLVMAAYGFVWVALLVYVWTVWRRLMKVEQDVKDLTARLTERRGRS